MHTIAVGSVFVLLVLTFAAGSVGLFIYHVRLYTDAVQFADQAAVHIYTDQDPQWMFSHFAPDEMAAVSPEGRRAFFRDNVGHIGPVLQISTPTGAAWFTYHFPAQFVAWAEMRAEGKSAFGPVLLYFDISDPGNGWRIDKTWSERAYTENPPDYH